MRHLTTLTLLTLPLLSAGCASTNTPTSAAIPRHTPLIFRGDGSPATLADINAAAKAADAILIGENHGHPLGLATAAKIWADLLPSSPNAALALEFFERDEQAHLDDFLAGITDEPAFIKAASLTPSNYPPGHREMILAAKSAHRPVIAANAPRRYVRLARTDGFDRLRALAPEQTRLFRIPDELPTGKYRENFEAFMSPTPTPASTPAHTGTTTPPPSEDPAALAERQKRTEAMFRSQSTWDWTMAESVARSLDAGHRPTLLVIGRFHIDQEGGTLLALKKLCPQTSTVTISFVDAWPPPPTTLAETDKDRADFIVYVGPGQE